MDRHHCQQRHMCNKDDSYDDDDDDHDDDVDDVLVVVMGVIRGDDHIYLGSNGIRIIPSKPMVMLLFLY